METQYNLPSGWVWTTLGEAALVNPRDRNLQSLPDDLPVTFVPMEAVDAETGSINAPRKMSLAQAKKGHTRFKENDVIFARITPCMENGKVALAKNLSNGLGFGSTEFHVLRSSEAIIPEFIYYFVRQQRFRDLAACHMAGAVGQARVPETFMRKAMIPLPPLPEQKRIATKIQELLQELRIAGQALQKVPGLIRQFRQSVLASAFRGELTERDPNDESVEKILERIRRERRGKPLESREDALGNPNGQETKRPSTKGYPALPTGWAWCRVDEVAEVRLGHQRSPRNRPDKYARKYLRAANVLEDAFDLSDVKEMDFKPGEFEVYKLRSGDVLLSEGSGTVEQTNITLGTCAVWEEQMPDCCFQNTLIRVRSEHVLSRYLLHTFTYARHKGDFAEIARGIGIAHLGAKRLSSYRIPIAPSNEQRHVVEAIDRLVGVSRSLEASVKATRRKLDLLEQSILKEAFNGRLVSQDQDHSE